MDVLERIENISKRLEFIQEEPIKTKEEHLLAVSLLINEDVPFMLEELGKRMQWVKCSERLPEHKQMVDIFLNGHRHIDVEFFIHRNEKFFYFNGRVIQWENVTHWMMPLPPNPKEEE